MPRTSTTIRDGDRARELADSRPRETITCEVCGTPRQVVAMSGRRRPTTCSDRCRKALSVRRLREAQRARD